MKLGNRNNKVLLYVVPLDANPYQELLYSSIRRSHPDRFKTLYWRRRRWVGIPYFFALAMWARVLGSRVVHIHWLSWDLRVNVPMRRRISGVIARVAIWWLGALQFHIIWTMHNLLPHETQTDNDLLIALTLARASDAIIVHSEIGLTSLAELGVPPRSINVIPHGNYVGCYGPAPAREAARQTLGIFSSSRVLLFFGQVRSYKGVPELLAAWTNHGYDGILIIAGSCLDDDLRSLITDRAEMDPSIIAHLHFVRDEDVATYFAAADGVCLPFRRTTTSGSVLLALSLGVPVVAPRIGALEELPNEVGFFYGTNREGLGGALQRFFDASERDLESRAANGLAYAESLSWASIGETTFDLYTRVSSGNPDPTASP